MAAPEDDFAWCLVFSHLIGLALSVAAFPPGTIIEHTVDVNKQPES